MSFFDAILYGLVQGLTEFLPVSSSGHLALLQSVFGLENMEETYMAFDVLLHLATLAAVLLVFRKDFFPLIPAFFSVVKKIFRKEFRFSKLKGAEKMLVYLVIATLPLVPAILIKDKVEAIYGIPKLIGAILILNGVVLFVSDRIGKEKKRLKEATAKDALSVGVFQMFALLPGLSRSGSTITGGLFCGFTREFAVKFSFLLSVPAILGANILSIPDLITSPLASSDLLPAFCGILIAFFSGIGAMKLLKYISRHANFSVFGVYCILVGLIALIFA